MKTAANIVASVAIHVAVIGGVVAIDELAHSTSDAATPLEVIYFEYVEETMPASSANAPMEPETPEKPKAQENPEALENLDTLDSLENLDTLEPLEDLEDLENPENLEPLENLESQETEERARIVSEPTALSRIEPTYPRSARRKGHEGCVVVEVAIAADGKVVGVDIVESCGYPELDAAAVDAVKTARFAPAKEDGVDVCGRLRLTFDFRLRQRK